MHKYIEWLLYEELHRLGFACLFRGVFLLRKRLAERNVTAVYRMTTVTEKVNRKDQSRLKMKVVEYQTELFCDKQKYST